MNELIDDTEMCQPEIFFELVEHWYATCPEFFMTEEQILELTQPAVWQWDWESPLRAQLRMLSGAPDVTGWTTEHAAVLQQVIQAPEAETLLGLSNDVTMMLPVDSDPADGGITDE